MSQTRYISISSDLKIILKNANEQNIPALIKSIQQLDTAGIQNIMALRAYLCDLLRILIDYKNPDNSPLHDLLKLEDINEAISIIDLALNKATEIYYFLQDYLKYSYFNQLSNNQTSYLEFVEDLRRYFPTLDADESQFLSDLAAVLSKTEVLSIEPDDAINQEISELKERLFSLLERNIAAPVQHAIEQVQSVITQHKIFSLQRAESNFSGTDVSNTFQSTEKLSAESASLIHIRRKGESQLKVAETFKNDPSSTRALNISSDGRQTASFSNICITLVSFPFLLVTGGIPYIIVRFMMDADRKRKEAFHLQQHKQQQQQEPATQPQLQLERNKRGPIFKFFKGWVNALDDAVGIYTADLPRTRFG